MGWGMGTTGEKKAGGVLWVTRAVALMEGIGSMFRIHLEGRVPRLADGLEEQV